MNSLQFPSTNVPQLNTGNKHNKLSDTSKESYFFQTVKSDENNGQDSANNKLLYPDVDGHILSILDQDSLKNMRRTSNVIKQFIDNKRRISR